MTWGERRRRIRAWRTGIGSDVIQIHSRQEGEGVRHSLLNCTLDLSIVDLEVLAYNGIPRKQPLGSLEPAGVATFWEPGLDGHADITYTYLIARAR